MSLRVFLESDPQQKRKLQEKITQLLPEWFGKPESNTKYASSAEVLDGFVVELEGKKRGLLLLKKYGNRSFEIYWMGVDPTCHRSGLGRALIDAVVEHARRNEAKYLFVTTLHPNADYEPYRLTTRFYEALGFEFVLEEQFPVDPRNPLAFYMRTL
jgi:ribosomal protein S18 acetylase RimI-like enzyme